MMQGSGTTYRDIEEEVDKLRRWQAEAGPDPEAQTKLRVEIERKLPDLDFGTKQDGAVVYTDRQRYGPDAHLYAEQTDRKTIEMTEGGRWLEDLRLYDGVFYRKDADALWHQASQRFCESASGEVTYFGPERPSERSTFYQVERPALQDNENVTKVTRVNGLKLGGYERHDLELERMNPREAYEQYDVGFKETPRTTSEPDAAASKEYEAEVKNRPLHLKVR